MVDITGKKYGRLTVLGPDKNRRGHVICQCDCGKRTSVRKGALTQRGGPRTRSCGCLRKEFCTENGKKTISSNSAGMLEERRRYHTNFGIIENPTPPKNNKSGHKGVWLDPKRGTYAAYIYLHGVKKHLGVYTNYGDAVKAREQAEDEMFAPLIAMKNEDCEGARI